MTPSAAAYRKQKKLHEARGSAVMVFAISAVAVSISWSEYKLLDFVEPWLRIVLIAIAWTGAVAMTAYAFGRATKSQPCASKRA